MLINLCEVNSVSFTGHLCSKTYHSVMDNLSVRHIDDTDLVVHDGTRIVVPTRAHKFVVKELHNAHSRLTKTLLTAQKLYYWTSMSSDIKTYIDSCVPCREACPAPILHSSSIIGHKLHTLENRIPPFVILQIHSTLRGSCVGSSCPDIDEDQSSPWLPRQNLLSLTLPSAVLQPMCSVSVELFSAAGQDWLAMVDRYRGYAWTEKLSSTSSRHIIAVLETWFTEFRWPLFIRSDNGPQFCMEFALFCTAHCIVHELSTLTTLKAMDWP